MIVFVNAPFVRAYEPDQLAECIAGALENPSIEGTAESSIQNYCECALDLIVDQNQDVLDSGYECAAKSFGWLVSWYLTSEISANRLVTF